MKLSIMLFPFHTGLSNGQFEAKQLVRDFACAGATAIEPMLSWIQKDPGKWAEFDEAVREQGLSYSCFDVGLNLVGTCAEDRRKAVDECARQVDFALEKLDCKIVMLPGSKPAEGMSNEDGRKLYGETLGRCAEDAAKKGVTICIEDFGVYPYFAASARHCLEVLDYAGPAAKFTFDNGNFLYGGDIPMDAFSMLSSRTCHVHIKDFVERPGEGPGLRSVNGMLFGGCMIGQGATQVTECVQAFKKIGYDGWFSIEVGGGNPLAQGVQGIEFVSLVK